MKIDEFINTNDERQRIECLIGEIKIKLKKLNESIGIQIQLYNPYGVSDIYTSHRMYTPLLFEKFSDNFDKLKRCDAIICDALHDYYEHYLYIFENRLKEINELLNIED